MYLPPQKSNCFRAPEDQFLQQVSFPKGPCSQIDIQRPQSTQIGTTLRPKYIYLDTWTLRVSQGADRSYGSCLGALCRVRSSAARVCLGNGDVQPVCRLVRQYTFFFGTNVEWIHG